MQRPKNSQVIMSHNRHSTVTTTTTNPTPSPSPSRFKPKIDKAISGSSSSPPPKKSQVKKLDSNKVVIGRRSLLSPPQTKTMKELAVILQEKQCVIEELQSQVLSLKAELDKSHSLNAELHSLNNKLSLDLDLILAHHHHHQSNEDLSPRRKGKGVQTPSKATRTEKETQSSPSSRPPPPPPPPPIRPPVARPLSAPKTKTPATIVDFYRSLTLRKQQEDNQTDPQPPPNRYKSTMSLPTTSVHNSIVGEIQNRSAHLLAIKADVETKGDFINDLVQKVVALAYSDIEDVLDFVDWLDHQLSTLADERAVLKHFNWPERKADAIREAAIEYRSLKQLEREITSFKDDTSIPCGTALKKMALLLDKSERGIGRLIKLRSTVLRTYQDWKIPTNWMLDSGIESKIKEGSMKLAKMYVKRVKTVLKVGRKSDREGNQEAVVLQGVQFVCRAHQFAGGLDSETLCAFEEIRQHALQHQIGVGVASRELLAAVPLS